ncbi:MAG TPA: class I SAM-dependent methyltransferase [Syntrophorhabdaceae bacterium]|nr:class I SAM-dependent methyltransferase [Syntrophorhabdaceae bacterium]
MSKAKRLLDLGCGYGWFEETLDAQLDLIAGIDCLIENKQPFLSTTAGKAREVVFQNQRLPSKIDFADGYFDVAVCAYSLYFFPDVLPEVSRVLADNGTFIVITHSERMLEEGKAFFNFENLHKIIKSFSAENGEQLLRRNFSKVRALDYPNSLIFNRTEEDDLASYIEFKKEFISRDCDPTAVKQTMIRELRKTGRLQFNKNDRIFFAAK